MATIPEPIIGAQLSVSLAIVGGVRSRVFDAENRPKGWFVFVTTGRHVDESKYGDFGPEHFLRHAHSRVHEGPSDLGAL